MEATNLIVLTGGPGAGKTALLEELERRGYACAREVAREIIREQVERKGSALPWEDREAFAGEMLERSLEQWRGLQGSGQTVFVDRGLPDTLCYARMAGLSPELQRRAEQACREYRYRPQVLIAPAWEQIYVTDAERRQSFAEAVATHDWMARTYADCGYEQVELPRVTVRERAEFLERVLGLAP